MRRKAVVVPRGASMGARAVEGDRAPVQRPTRRKAPTSYRIGDALALAVLALCLCGALWGMAACYQAGYQAALASCGEAPHGL